MKRALSLSMLALISLSACKTSEAPTPPADASSGQDQGHGEGDQADLDGREVVDNWKAQVGDVTVCPLSGKKFEVEEDSGRYQYQGYTFVFCCAGGCLDKVAADPGKYLDALVEQAGPASDPDPNEGGAIDDT